MTSSLVSPLRLLLSVVAGRRSGLRRGSDVIEMMVVAVAVILAPLAPVAGVVAGQLVFAVSAAQAEQAAGRFHTTAVLAEDAAAPVVTTFGGLVTGSLVRASWLGPDGAVHTGQIMAVAGMRAGQQLPLWTDSRGSPVTAPDSPEQLRASAAFIGTVSGFGWLVLLAAAVAWVRWLLDRHRLRGWQTQWTAVESSWRRELL